MIQIKLSKLINIIQNDKKYSGSNFKIKKSSIILCIELIFFLSSLIISIVLYKRVIDVNDYFSIILIIFLQLLVIAYLLRIYKNIQLLQMKLDERSFALITESNKKKEIDKSYKEQELNFKTIIEYGFDGITIVDKEGNTKFTSISTEKITGYSCEEFREGAITFDKIHPDDMQRVIENFRNISENKITESTIYYRYLHKNGEWRNLEVSVSNLLNNSGVEGILFIYRDITKHTEAEQKARYLEYYDKLTDLPNQLFFSEKIDEVIKRSSARKRAFAVMCLGINSFKNINGEYGTIFGDLVLKEIGARLKSNFRGDDFVSRMMGDKFLILFSDMNSESDVIAIVQKTMSSFKRIFCIKNTDISISVSIGISLYPQDGSRKDELIKNSETALFICKENREYKYSLFNKEQNNELISRIQIEKELAKSIENRDFSVYYQPKVDKNGKIIGAEALIRWFSSEKGFISPEIFIPISERNGSIIQIGQIVMDKVFNDINKWISNNLEPVRISINVASLQLSNNSFIQSVVDLQKEYKIDPSLIEFEITETGIIKNEEEAVRVMKELNKLGFSISIDDFGTGYSSLSKLKNYPINVLKIDKSFIDPIPDDTPSCNIVSTIIDLAHHLDYTVVAEGVEFIEQVKFLHKNQCDLIQGYFYYKPVPQVQFAELL